MREKGIKWSNKKIDKNGLRVEVLSRGSLIWYVQQLSQDYFIEYTDIQKPSRVQIEMVKIHLKGTINTMKNRETINEDIRLIIKVGDEPVGGITIIPNEDNDNEVEIAYWITPLSQSKGIATRAIEVVIGNLVIENKQLEYVVANVLDINKPSKNLMKKLGFIQTSEFKTNNRKLKAIRYEYKI